jgi:hypothetical protein
MSLIHWAKLRAWGLPGFNKTPGSDMAYVNAIKFDFKRIAMGSCVKSNSGRDPRLFSGNVGRYFANLSGFVIAIVTSCGAHATATCTVVSPVVTFAVSPVLNVPQDLPVGKTLSSWVVTPTVLTHQSCVFSPPSDVGVGAKGTGSNVGTTTDEGGTYQIFKSPTQGIGYIMKGKDKNGSYVPIGRDFTRFIVGSSSYFDVQFAIKLVATGAPIVSGSVPSFQVAEANVYQGSTFSAPSLLFMPATSVVANT